MKKQPTVDMIIEEDEPSTSSPKSLIDLTFVLVEEERDLTLTHKEARAGSPDDTAVCGEEDIGSALEFLVTKDDPPLEG